MEKGGVDMLSEGPTDAQAARFQSIRGSPLSGSEVRSSTPHRAEKSESFLHLKYETGPK